jgi:hypothetical protein
MKELFRRKAISIGTKKFIYQAMPLSTVPRGCKTWALKEEEKRMLEVFHHGATRRIIGIIRQIIRADIITNSAARKKFLDMTTMVNLVQKRVLKYIGNVVREEKEIALHTYFLIAYCHSTMHIGGHQKSYRYLFIECVRTILPDTPTSAPLKTWIHEVHDRGKLNALVRDGWESKSTA